MPRRRLSSGASRAVPVLVLRDACRFASAGESWFEHTRCARNAIHLWGTDVGGLRGGAGDAATAVWVEVDLEKLWMKSIQVYDPAMCCSTGVCGTQVEPDLVSFAAMLSQFRSHGIEVERYNLAQQPLAFVQNAAVRTVLETEGVTALPLIFWDRALRLRGRYPNKDERPDWCRAAHNLSDSNTLGSKQ